MSTKRASSTFKLPLASASPPAKRARLASPAVAESSSSSTFTPAAFLASLPSAPASSTSKQSEQELLQLECDSMDPSWLSLLQDEVRRPHFLKLKDALWKEGVRGVGNSTCKGKVFPPPKDIYAWSRYTPLHKVKVVIIGQDPYHDDGQAHGLCFSVQPGVKIPPSLRNIYKELKTEFPDFVIPSHGSLISLARSGVLLLNTSLTVRAHNAGSHSKLGWEEFTDKVVDLVAKYGGSGEVGSKSAGVVFLAWGAWAAKRVAKLDKTKHLVLESAHPSPLSARRGFFGNNHFIKANEWLVKRYGDSASIDWTKLELEAAPSAGQIVDEQATATVVVDKKAVDSAAKDATKPLKATAVAGSEEKGGKQTTLMAAWGKKAARG